MLVRGELEGELYLSQWLGFSDENGAGWAQPDAFLVQENLVVIFEMKLTQTESARAQLLSLYAPLIKEIFGLPCVCIQVCKNIRERPHHKITHPRELVFKPKPGMWTWHYLGA